MAAGATRILQRRRGRDCGVPHQPWIQPERKDYSGVLSGEGSYSPSTSLSIDICQCSFQRLYDSWRIVHFFSAIEGSATPSAARSIKNFKGNHDD